MKKKMEKTKLFLTEEETKGMESLLALTIPVTELDIPIASASFQDGHTAELSVVKHRNESRIHPSMTLLDADGDEEDWKDGANLYSTWKMRTWYGGEYEIEIVNQNIKLQ